MWIIYLCLGDINVEFMEYDLGKIIINDSSPV